MGPSPHTHTYTHIHSFIEHTLIAYGSLSLLLRTVSFSFLFWYFEGLSGKKCNCVNIMGCVFEQLHGNTNWEGNTHIDKHTCLRKLARAPVPPALLLPRVFWILTSSRLVLAASLSHSESFAKLTHCTVWEMCVSVCMYGSCWHMCPLTFLNQDFKFKL